MLVNRMSLSNTPAHLDCNLAFIFTSVVLIHLLPLPALDRVRHFCQWVSRGGQLRSGRHVQDHSSATPLTLETPAAGLAAAAAGLPAAAVGSVAAAVAAAACSGLTAAAKDLAAAAAAVVGLAACEQESLNIQFQK